MVYIAIQFLIRFYMKRMILKGIQLINLYHSYLVHSFLLSLPNQSQKRKDRSFPNFLKMNGLIRCFPIELQFYPSCVRRLYMQYYRHIYPI